MLRLAFDFIITWRETRTRPNAYRIDITSREVIVVMLLQYFIQIIVGGIFGL